MIDFLASYPWYVDHIRPVWLALPPEVRGRFYVSQRSIRAADGLPGVTLGRPGGEVRPIYTVSFGDYRSARMLGRQTIALGQHGAGQSYSNDHPAYPGGRGQGEVSLFLVPNETAAARTRAAYPRARVEIVGCPKLDALPRGPRSIGISCEPWTDFAAAIRSPLRTRDLGQEVGLCVAHAIASVKWSALDTNAELVTAPSRNTTASGTSGEGLKLPADLQALAREATEAVSSAMSKCTRLSDGSCRASATSAERSLDLKWLFDGTLLKSDGSYPKTDEGSHILSIPTTTFGSVSLAIPCMTAKADTGARAARQAVICTSFHWNSKSIAPETTSAWEHYQRAIILLSRHRHVLGHAHPREMFKIGKWYQRSNIEVAASFDDVLRRADVYACDNSSSLFEFAATGRPVVVLNHPAYRRNVEHGLRFWAAAGIGVNVDDHLKLGAAVERAIEDPPEMQAAREKALRIVYQPLRGGAELAAAALVDWANSQAPEARRRAQRERRVR